eukprot:2579976-Prymnesium_polylepis.1
MARPSPALQLARADAVHPLGRVRAKSSSHATYGGPEASGPRGRRGVHTRRGAQQIAAREAALGGETGDE